MLGGLAKTMRGCALQSAISGSGGLRAWRGPGLAAAAGVGRPPSAACPAWSHAGRCRPLASLVGPASPGPLPQEEPLPFTVYTPEANAAYWRARPLAVVLRGLRIGAALLHWLVTGYVLPGGASPTERERRRGAALRRTLAGLGAAAVKIGQAVSSRPDVVPPEFAAELELLQDRLDPYPDAQAMSILTDALGGPPERYFADLSPSPVAAASLGQVYRGALRAGGAAVAVKVQRPGVAARIALDVHILRGVAAALCAAGHIGVDLPALLDEWAGSMFRELDYRQEAAHGERFRDLYARLPDVHVPRMYPELTTRRVLVMEWVTGTRLRTAGSRRGEVRGGRSGEAATHAGGFSSTPCSPSEAEDLRLVDVGVRCSLEQMLESGFYHADPHPGNLLRTENGRLAYIDFGMMGEVGPGVRRGLLAVTLHLINREYSALAGDFAALGIVPGAHGGGDAGERERQRAATALTAVFKRVLAGGTGALSFGELSTELGRTMYEHRFRIPSHYTLLVRSLSVLEGIALASDPGYKVLGAAYPWVARRLLTDPSPDLRATLLGLLYKNGKFRFDRLAALLDQASRDEAGRAGEDAAKPTPSHDAGTARHHADDAGTARHHADDRSTARHHTDTASTDMNVLALLLDERGDFLRGVLIEELAKALDAALRMAARDAGGAVKAGLAQRQRAERAAKGPASPSSGAAAGEPAAFHCRHSRAKATTAPDGCPSLGESCFASGNPGAKPGCNSDDDPVRVALMALLNVCEAIPVSEDDEAQVAGLVHLAAALEPGSREAGPHGAGSEKTGEAGLAQARAALEAVVAVAAWIRRESQGLSPAQKEMASGLPLQLAQALLARLFARWLDGDGGREAGPDAVEEAGKDAEAGAAGMDPGVSARRNETAALRRRLGRPMPRRPVPQMAGAFPWRQAHPWCQAGHGAPGTLVFVRHAPVHDTGL